MVDGLGRPLLVSYPEHETLQPRRDIDPLRTHCLCVTKFGKQGGVHNVDDMGRSLLIEQGRRITTWMHISCSLRSTNRKQ